MRAQNDVVAGTAAVEKAQSQVALTQTTEQRAHQSLLANGGPLKDWQQAQADLATAQNRLRIILVQSGRAGTASLRSGADQSQPDRAGAVKPSAAAKSAANDRL